MKKILSVLALSLSSYAYSGSDVANVDSLMTRASDGLLYFTLKNGNPINKPACATHGYWMIKDENSETGKLQFSILLTALVSGKKVQVIGNNNCTRWGDGEDVEFVRIYSE